MQPQRLVHEVRASLPEGSFPRFSAKQIRIVELVHPASGRPE